MTDEPTDKALENLFVEETGFDTDDFPAAIFGFARAVLAKWGTPAGAGEPFGYFHQLLNHEGKGNGVWLGAAERKVVEQAHTPGETSEEIVALYTTPQPTQAQAGTVPLTDEQIQDLLLCGNPTDEEMRLIRIGWDAAHGIKGCQHGTE